MTALDPRLSTQEWQLRAGLVALMVVATIILVTTAPRLFHRGRERVAIALGASAELSLWGAFLIAPGIGPAHAQHNLLGMRLWFLAVLVVVTAAFYLPLLRKLSKRRETK